VWTYALLFESYVHAYVTDGDGFYISGMTTTMMFLLHQRWRPCWWWYRMHIGIMYRCITRPCMSLICICVWWVNVIGKLHVGNVVNLFVLMNNFEVELSVVQLIEVSLMYIFFKLFILIMIDVKLTPVVLTACLFVWMGRRRAWVIF